MNMDKKIYMQPTTTQTEVMTDSLMLNFSNRVGDRTQLSREASIVEEPSATDDFDPMWSESLWDDFAWDE